MQITVFGASGKVGSRVVEEALRRGYDVVAFVHSHNLFSPTGKLVVVQGDIYSASDVAKALKGSSAVLSCLGSWGTPKKNVLTTAMHAILPAMREQQIERIVTLTGSGAADPHARPGVVHRLLLRLLAPFPAGKVFRDGEEHLRLLAMSELEWTSLRSPVMNNLGSSYALNLKPAKPWETIGRDSVAAAMLDQLETATYVGQAPIIHRK